MPIVRVGGARGSDGEDYDTFEVADLTCRSYFSQNDNWSPPIIGETPRLTKTSLTSSTSRSVDSVSIDSLMGSRSNDTNRKGNMIPQYLENLDMIQNDPRTPLSNKSRGAGYIPEEDETSISSMGDSAATQTPSMRSSSHHHFQKQRLTKTSDIYIKSMSALDRDNAVVINQLEAHVANVNFELATTKALLDELRLKNRHITDDIKAVLNENDRLHDENDRLHITIQTMEKEKLLTSRKISVQDSIGTVHTTAAPPEQRKFSRVVWSGSEFHDLVQDAEDLWGQRIWSESTDGRNTFDTSASGRKTVDAFATYKSELRQLRSSAASDASSLSPDIVPPPMPKPARNGSKKSVMFNNLVTVKKSFSYNKSGNGAAPPMLRHTKDELDVPFGNSDDESSSSNYSTHSVRLGEPGNDVDVHDRIRNDEKQDMSHVGRLSLLKLIVGNTEKLQQVAAITKQIHKACPLLSAQHNTIQEDYNDPFSTWSAPGDPKRLDEKWIQSGQRGFSDGVGKKLPPYPEIYSNADKQYDGVRKYSSFFENCSDDGKKKGFNLFRSFRK